MAVQEAYNDWSSTYDSDINLTRDLDQTVVRETFKSLHFKGILEIGCGTGKNTQFLSQIAERVSAVDFSEGMMKRAKEKTDADNVEFLLADITKPWPFEDGSFDLIVCNLVLEHIEDLSFIFSEASRTLIKVGEFFISELHPFRQYQGKKARFERNDNTIEIHAFIHNVSDFIRDANINRLTLKDLREWRHENDQNNFPRLISFIFKK